MSRLGLLLALAGLALALALLASQDLGAVGALLAGAGFGLVLAALAHIPAMVLNARAWALLLPRRRRPGLARMTWLVWLRESINALLPVGRVGGEVACYRLQRADGVPAAPVAAALLADVALSVFSQLAFALLGLALLAMAGAAVGWVESLLAMAFGFALAAGFVLAQRAAPFSRILRAVNRLAADRLGGLVANAARIDRMTRRLWRRRRVVAWSFLWQFAAWIAGALEIWVALWALGHPVGWMEALAIEALIQAVSSAAFLVPGALGLQEAGFLGLGALLGLPPEVSAALALTRRIRDLVLYLPGLLAWVWAERRLARLPAAG
ncbi:MAG: lysylphosphatidylglycerol synthase domain-containing protein [Acetobacteraceae bacterium]|nr:lysylphosphatidylglycerol synthase domain-containing protein [Acetobacteraceae bacterium]